MELKGLKVNFLGDSITAGAGVSAQENCYVEVFARASGATVRNYGISGTRIARQTKPSVKAQFDLNFLDRVDGMDPDADLVVVFGGTNDFGHGDAAFGDPDEAEDEYTFRGAVHSLIRRLRAKFPTSEIVIMTPLHRTGETATVNEIGLPRRPLADYVAAEREIAAAYSVPVLDLFSVAGIYPDDPVNCEIYTKDGLHPNDRGAARIADRLIGFLGTL